MNNSKAGRSGKPTEQVQNAIDAMLLAGFQRNWFTVKAEQLYRGQRKEKLPSGVPIVRSIFEQGRAIIRLRWKAYEANGITYGQLEDLIEPMLETGELDVRLHRFRRGGTFEVDWMRTEITPGTGIKKIVSYSYKFVEEWTLFPDGSWTTEDITQRPAK